MGKFAQRKRMLWIEDGKRFELVEQMAPAYYSGEYILHLAEDVVDGINHLRSAESGGKPYDVVIVDIRLPPGEDKVWYDLYKRTIHSQVESQLGLILLYWLFEKDLKGNLADFRRPGNPRAGKDIEERLTELKHSGVTPPNVEKKTVAVYTVEHPPLVCPHLNYLGIEVYAQKTIDTPDDILLKLARAVEGEIDGFQCPKIEAGKFWVGGENV